MNGAHIRKKDTKTGYVAHLDLVDLMRHPDWYMIAFAATHTPLRISS